MRLVVCGSIANSRVGGSPAGGVNAGSADTVIAWAIHQLAAVNVSGVGVTRVCASGNASIVTVPTGAFVSRTV
jgi:hypothetical protein